jgi:RNA polymerase sigma factor (sigma-70 family)
MAVGASIHERIAVSPYEEHRTYVLAVLARRCGWLDPSDREALFHDAYAVFLEKQRGGQLDVSAMRAPQIRAYLTQTSLNKAMDEQKRAGRRRSVSLDNDDLGIEPVDPQRSLDERVAERFDDARVREIVAKLPERQQLVIKLRFFFNRTPEEIQHYMGVTERVYRRELERATRTLAERFELVRDGTFCESQRSLMLAYVTGVAGPTRKLQARRHLDSCLACASWVMGLRTATRTAAAFVPAPVLVLPLRHWLLHHTIDRVASVTAGARHRASELVGHVRAHATHALLKADGSRVVALGSARPSAVAVIVTGCLAGGTTAGYCVVQGLPAPVKSLIGAAPAPHAVVAHRHDAPRHHRLHRAAPATAPASVSPQVSAQPPTTAPVTPVPPTTTTPSAVARSAGTHPPVHRVPVSDTKPRSTRNQATRVQRQTNPEFGVGSATPTPQTRPPTSAPTSQPTDSTAIPAPATPTSGVSAAPSSSPSGSDSGSGGSSHAAANKPLPEFDP